MKILLVRHGESVFNSAKIMPNFTNREVPLSLIGKSQAKKVAKKIFVKFGAPDRIFATKYLRTEMTADPLAQKSALPIEYFANFRELDFLQPWHDQGNPAEKVHENIYNWWTKTAKNPNYTDPILSNHPEAIHDLDSLNALISRIFRAVSELKSSKFLDGEYIVIFSHAFAISTAIDVINGFSFDEIVSRNIAKMGPMNQVKNTQVVEISRKNNILSVVNNDVFGELSERKFSRN